MLVGFLLLLLLLFFPALKIISSRLPVSLPTTVKIYCSQQQQPPYLRFHTIICGVAHHELLSGVGRDSPSIFLLQTMLGPRKREMNTSGNFCLAYF